MLKVHYFFFSAQKQAPNKAGGYCLNLSAKGLTAQTCIVLAKVLMTDRAFSEIKLSDCMLTEEGKFKHFKHLVNSGNHDFSFLLPNQLIVRESRFYI